MAVSVTIALGFVLRIAFLIRAARKPEDARFVADPYAYIQMAEQAYHGHLFVSFRGFPTSYLSVGYPAIVALLQRLLFGIANTWTTALIVNLLCYVATSYGLVSILRTYMRKSTMSDRARQMTSVSVVAIFAVLPDSIFATGLVMTEPLAICFLIWAIVLLSGELYESSSGPRLVAGSLLLGLTVFVRPSTVFLIAAIGAVFVFAHHLKQALVLVLISCIPLVPLYINNQRVGTGPGITSATWMNVCDGLLKKDGRFEWRRDCRRTELPGESVDKHTEARNTAWAKKIALLEIGNNPMQWVSRMPLRLYRSIWAGGWSTEVSVKWGQNYKWTEHIMEFRWFSRRLFDVVAVMGIVQLCFMVHRRRFVAWPVWCVVIGTLAGVLISFGQPRFGWPLAVLVLVPLAALFIGESADRFLSKR